MRIFSIVCSCLLSLLLYVAGPADANEKQKIIVGGDHENPPYEFLEDGKPTGFNVDLMRAVADAVGVEVEIRLGPWGDVRRELEQGKIDALAGMYYSEVRSKAVDFSVPHTMVSAGLFVRSGSPIRNMEDIKGKEVIVQKGDVIDDYLHEKGIASRLIEVKDPADALRLLASGRHDCALMPSRFQGEYLRRALGISNVRGISVDLPQFRYCFAVKKGNDPLRFRLDEGLNILKLNGKYQEIYNKWFGAYEKRTLWRTVRYFVWALVLIAGLLAASSTWSWFLRREVRKRTAELRDREESLRFTQYAIDNSTDQAFWMTEEGRLFYVNDAACSTLGYTREELLKLSIPDIDPIYRPEKFAEHWRDLHENGYATFETVHRAKDGRVYPVEIRANYVVFDGKEYNCAFATEISARKRMEEDLRRSHDELEKRVEERTAELRRAKELLEEEISVRNRTERVITARLRLLEFAASHSLNELLEATIDEAEALTGSSIGFYHFLEPDQKTLSLQNWSTRTKAEFCTAEGKGLHYDVSAAGVWVDCVLERRPVIHNDYASLPHRRGLPPVHADVFRELLLPLFRGDNIVAIIGVGNKPQDYTPEDVEAVSFLADFAWEITERKQAEEALRESEARVRRKKDLLEELNRTLEERVREEVMKNREKDVMLIQQNRQAALGEILDHIAHQWKQPLNAIAIITYLLKDNYSLSTEEVNETADKILGQVEHMSQTLNVFRNFYRPDKEKSLFLIKESIDLAISIIKPALQFEYINVEVEADQELVALGYPKEFSQVLINLLSNARDAFREKKVEEPRLNVKGIAEGNMAVVTVTDNAGGICEEAIARIFDMNFTTKESSGGTGIGLYMAKNIIERHMGGELKAENVSDGAQFSIRLCIAESAGNAGA